MTEVTRMNLFNIQVCSDETIEEALEWVRKNEPAGTTNNWQITDDPDLAPVDCIKDDGPREGFKHYVFVC